VAPEPGRVLCLRGSDRGDRMGDSTWKNATVEATLGSCTMVGVALGDDGGDDRGHPRWVRPHVLLAPA
jgi:hypothetical protein